MTHIHRTDELLEQEEEGICDLILVAVRYIGDKSVQEPSQLQQIAAWPGSSVFHGGSVIAYIDKHGEEYETPPDGAAVRGVVDREPGRWQLGLVPDVVDEDESPDNTRNVSAIERASDWEVSYDESDIAEAMVNSNYLPSDIFQNGYDPKLRQRVFNRLDLEDRGAVNELNPEDEEMYREQLREIAGIDDEPSEEELLVSDVDELMNEHSRGELMSAASDLGIDNANTGKQELAEFLVTQDDYEEAL